MWSPQRLRVWPWGSGSQEVDMEIVQEYVHHWENKWEQFREAAQDEIKAEAGATADKGPQIMKDHVEWLVS